MEDKKAEIFEISVHYKVCGAGPNPLLLIHGAVGSANDFSIQLTDESDGLDRSKFTIVALDLPGFGESGTREEIGSEPTMEYFEFCARVCAKLMQILGFKTYAVGGWNDGARVASLLAVNHQSRVDALLLWGFIPVMDPQSSHAIAKTRDTSIWDPRVVSFYSNVYGEQKFSEMWRKYVDFVIKALELPDRFDIRSKLSQIKCPTLVLHGTEDPIVSYKDHVKPIESQIYNSEVIQIKGIAHNIHQADPSRFNQILSRLVDSVCVH